MPRKIRQLVADLKRAGFYQLGGGGKGSHRKFLHKNRNGAVNLSGKDGADAKRYQEQQVKKAIDDVS